MAGFGAEKHEMRLNASKMRLKTMTIHLPVPEGRADHTIVDHDHHPPHNRESYSFAPNENAELAAHLSKHLGIALPGKASETESAESAESKQNFEG
jgi:hypothetical protein